MWTHIVLGDENKKARRGDVEPFLPREGKHGAAILLGM